MPREISAAEEKALARYEALGTPEEISKQIETLKRENADRREKNKNLETENAALKTKVPEGATVLSAEEAKVWNDLQALKLTPKQIKDGLAERDLLKTETAKRSKRDALSSGAAAEGWGDHAADLLMDINGFDGVTVELRDVETEIVNSGRKETKTVKVPYFTEGDKAPIRGSEWVKTTKPHLETLLKATNGKREPDSGRTVPDQRGGGGTGTGKKEITQEDVRKSSERTVHIGL